MRISIAIVITVLLASFNLFGQGVSVYTGTTVAKNGVESFTPNGFSHSGFHIGADGMLGDDAFVFIAGGQYHSIGYNATESFSFSHEEKMNILKGRLGASFKIFQIEEIFQLNARAIGSIDYFLGIPESHDGPAPFNEAVMGGSIGLEAQVFFLSLIVEYEKGFFKSFNMVENSSFNYLTFSLGFRF